MKWRSIGTNYLHRLFYPVVGTVITTRYEGEVGGMAAVSYMPLSLQPPLMGVSISLSHRTNRLVRKSRYFAINLLDIKYAANIAYMGKPTKLKIKDKVSAADFTVKDGKATDTAIIQEASAVAECKVVKIYRTGDHDLFIGECVALYAMENFIEYWNFKKYLPALYVGARDGEEHSFLTLKF